MVSTQRMAFLVARSLMDFKDSQRWQMGHPMGKRAPSGKLPPGQSVEASAALTPLRACHRSWP